ncbi:hypothetical protein GUITHDRAFT_163835 [Guillardia theta CCMP2712]|uniref:Anaphase-promoting complex subunit 4 WD40 domain-containing protein n=2 Tax=Guillardia theta TaxID=55529 RepID=L1J4G2_GUITC|nr:hypothetical protein GUITHDRAFT_163835 [Guillardia theta CCMP2712]EKX43386.1 hypothetical protein GUITHDRAFT_163835 [Guillardia theta CCMP2712]|eukprot:XP_005830366.1 hypothetical protein GUITHDRAFT_163835 [Guillardia theta CCMP2712]
MSRGFAKYVKLKYPPTASAVLSDKLFAVGGGGGKSKSGIPNRISLLCLDQDELKEIAHLDFDDDRVVGLCASPKGKVILCTTHGGKTHAVGYNDKELKLMFSMATGKADPSGDYPSQRAVAFNPAGTQVVISHGEKLGMWDFSTSGLKLIRDFGVNADGKSWHAEAIRDVCFHPDGKRILSHDDSTCCIWDAKTGKLLFEHLSEKSSNVGKGAQKFRGAVFTEDGNKIITALSTRDAGFIQEHKVDKDLPIVRQKKIVTCPITTISGLDKMIAFVGCSDGRVAMLNCANIGIQCCLDIHSMPITKVHALKSHNCFSIAFDNFCGHGLMQAKIHKQRRQFAMFLIFAFLFLLSATVFLAGGDFIRKLQGTATVS